jgi:hypothetical protein
MAKKKNALATIDERFAKDANIAAGMEANMASGQFISAKSGVLQIDGNPLPGNKMTVVILDTVMENLYYAGKYDPKNVTGPECYGFGRSEEDMKPHEKVIKAKTNKSKACESCELNEWGTADTGEGKACKNIRRLALIAAGTPDKNGDCEIFDKPEDFEKADLQFLKLPVTSVKGYAAFVKQIAGSMSRPPHGIITEISAIPDEKSTFKLVFECVGKVENNVVEAVLARHDEAKTAIIFPYADFDKSDKPAKGKTKTKGKKRF